MCKAVLFILDNAYSLGCLSFSILGECLLAGASSVSSTSSASSEAGLTVVSSTTE
jgi:hypothetical protein